MRRRQATPTRPAGRRGRVSYAHGVAALALFLSLSSGALAARHFVISSTKQIKPSVLAALRGKDGPKGTPGGPGLSGARGSVGDAGARGPLGPAPTVLAPNQTESGVWAGGYEINEGRVRYRLTVSFPIPLVAPKPEGSVGYIAKGAPPTAACPGPGRAASGVLCLYEAASENLVTPTAGDVFDPEDFEGPPEATGRSGFGIELSAKGEDPSAVTGTWAVTAADAGIRREPAALPTTPGAGS